MVLFCRGGNKQKLAIARALYQDSSLLILDEITSAVDMEAEKEILDMLELVRKDKILLSVSHKMSCVRDSDRILFIENGRIAETGSHSELIAKRGKYYAMFKLQMDQFKKASMEDTLRNEEWL